jgi:hypothetical protein
LINEEINNEINKLNFQGKNNEELKNLYIKRNSLNINTESFIYRICRADFLINDIKNSKITFTKICSDTYGDLLENPLLNKEFIDNNERFTLGFLENYYALCWTDDPADNKWRWDRFLEGRPGVRIKVSLHKLMDRLMNTQDIYFMMHYFAIKVNYKDYKTIDDLTSTNDYTQFLDSLGQRAALSVATLSDNLEDEKEIRTVYSYMPENSFIVEDVKIEKNLCKLPFDWNEVIEEVLIASYIPIDTYNSIASELRALGLSCTIERSQAMS